MRLREPLLQAIAIAVAFGGCAVDPAGLPGDGSVSFECVTDAQCADGIDCTDDGCVAHRCVHVTRDEVCAAGEACIEGTGCQPAMGCRPTECADSLRNDGACQVGECQSEGTCRSVGSCAAGESCCGDGSCRDCDDGNPCTVDSCGPGGCVHEPISLAPCDDGVFCNGTEVCNAGVCESSGDPCALPTTCEVNRCVGCRTSADCPDPIRPAFGACTFGGDTCLEDGTRRRTVTTFECVGDACVGTDAEETQSCARDTDGNACGAETVGPWGVCGGFAGTCDQSGTRTRTRTTFVCAGGGCGETMTTDTEGCARDTDNVTCGPTTTSDWSPCAGFTGPCGENGSQTRSVTDRICRSGTCSDTAGSESRSCMRDSNGVSCGTTTVTMSACTFPTGCATAGTRDVITSTYTCGAGACLMDVQTTTEPCARVTDGQACNPANPCGGACSGGVCDPTQADGLPCDDGLTCTFGDQCTSGVCRGSTTCGPSQTRCMPNCNPDQSCQCLEDGAIDRCGCA